MYRAIRLAILLMLPGCGARSIAADRTMDTMAGDEISVVSLGSPDILNEYPSTVKVAAHVLMPDHKAPRESTCSGLLVSPRVVLTAGHCVCNERKTDSKGITTIDRKSGCAKSATVQLLHYRPKKDEVRTLKDVSREWGDAHEGIVLPHEDLKIVYSSSIKEDARTMKAVKNTEYSNADLAIIVLNESLENKADYRGHASLATQPVEFNRGDEVVLVGVGSDVGTPVGQDRLYGYNNIISTKADETTFAVGRQIRTEKTYEGERPRIERDLGSYLMPGDSGGPCYLKREDLRTQEVIGIAKTHIGGDFVLSSYTNINKYLEWLHSKIAEANKASSN
jgi:hypothetical protein